MTTASALLLRARDPTAAGRRELVAEAEPLVTHGLERCHLATAWAQLGDARRRLARGRRSRSVPRSS